MNLSAVHRELVSNGIIKSSRQYFTRLVKEGKIPYDENDGKKVFNYNNVVKALGECISRPSMSNPSKDIHNYPTPKKGQSKEDYEQEVVATLGDNPSLTDSKVFLTIYQGKLAQQKFDVEEGLLVYREDIEQKAFTVIRVLRDQILAIPERLAGDVASTTDPKEVKEIMYKEINEVLSFLSSEKVLYE